MKCVVDGWNPGKIPGSFFERLELVLFGRPGTREWLKLHRRLFGRASGDNRRRALLKLVKLSRQGRLGKIRTWRDITQEWNEGTGENLSRNAVMVLHSKASTARRRKQPR